MRNDLDILKRIRRHRSLIALKDCQKKNFFQILLYPKVQTPREKWKITENYEVEVKHSARYHKIQPKYFLKCPLFSMRIPTLGADINLYE